MTYIHLCSYVHFVYALSSVRQEGKKKKEDEAAVPAVHYQFPFPSYQSCLLVPFLPTGFSVVMCFHPYLRCFTLTIVLFPLNFLHPQPLWPSAPLPQTRQASQCLVCSIFHHWWEDVLFTVPRTPAVTHWQQRGSAQYSSWRAEVKGVTAGRSEVRKDHCGVRGALCTVCVCVTVVRGQSKTTSPLAR